jgi:hypothetical protein
MLQPRTFTLFVFCPRSKFLDHFVFSGLNTCIHMLSIEHYTFTGKELVPVPVTNARF